MEYVGLHFFFFFLAMEAVDTRFGVYDVAEILICLFPESFYKFIFSYIITRPYPVIAFINEEII